MINYKINANPMLMKLCYTNNNHIQVLFHPSKQPSLTAISILFFIPVQRVSISK